MTNVVVLLPSLGRPARDFDHLSGALRDGGYDPLAIEPPPTVPDGTTLEQLAHGVLEVTTARGAARFHLVGHAFGNRLARMVTAVAPDRVASLTLLAAGGLVPMPADAATALLNCFALRAGTPEHLAAVRAGFFADGHDPSVWADGWHPQIAAYQRAAVAATPHDRWWDAVAPRVLVIQGLNDAIAVPENGRRYVAAHADVAELVEIQDAGHALIVEQPDAVASAVRGFLDSQR